MKKIVLLCLMFLPLMLFGNDTELGYHLVNRLFHDIKHNDTHSVSKYISPAFQETVPSDQIRRTAKQELAVIEEAAVTHYSVTSMRVTRKGKDLITTYKVALDVISNGETVHLPSTYRLSVWQWNGKKWLWTAHQGGV